MAEMWGMDVDQARRLEKSLRAKADELETVHNEASAATSNLRAAGPAIESFRRIWDVQYSPDLVRAARALREAADVLWANAAAQAATSHADGEGGGPSLKTPQTSAHDMVYLTRDDLDRLREASLEDILNELSGLVNILGLMLDPAELLGWTDRLGAGRLAGKALPTLSIGLSGWTMIDEWWVKDDGDFYRGLDGAAGVAAGVAGLYPPVGTLGSLGWGVLSVENEFDPNHRPLTENLVNNSHVGKVWNALYRAGYVDEPLSAEIVDVGGAAIGGLGEWSDERPLLGPDPAETRRIFDEAGRAGESLIKRIESLPDGILWTKGSVS